MRALRTTRYALLLIIGGLLVVGCGDDDSTDAADLGPPAVIVAIDNSFDPFEQKVAAGTLVRWENQGSDGHDIVPEDPDAPWAVPVEDFAPGDVAEYVFTEPGRYKYFCSIHGDIDMGMPGLLIVE